MRIPRNIIMDVMPQAQLPQRGIFASQDDGVPPDGGGRKRRLVLPPEKPDWQPGTKANHLVEYAARRWGVDVSAGAGSLINPFGHPNHSLIPPLLVEYGAGHLAGLVTDYLQMVKPYDSTFGLRVEQADIDWLIADFEDRYGVRLCAYPVPNPVTAHEFDAVILGIRRETLRLYFQAQTAGDFDLHPNFGNLNDRHSGAQKAVERVQAASGFFSQGNFGKAKIDLVKALIDAGDESSPESMFILQMIALLPSEEGLSFAVAQKQVLELLDYYKERGYVGRAKVQFFFLRKAFAELTVRATPAQVNHVREKMKAFVAYHGGADGRHVNIIEQALDLVMTPVLNGLHPQAATADFGIDAAFDAITAMAQQQLSGRALTDAKKALANARAKIGEVRIKSAVDSLNNVRRIADRDGVIVLSSQIEDLIQAIRKKYAV